MQGDDKVRAACRRVRDTWGIIFSPTNLRPIDTFLSRAAEPAPVPHINPRLLPVCTFQCSECPTAADASRAAARVRPPPQPAPSHAAARARVPAPSPRAAQTHHLRDAADGFRQACCAVVRITQAEHELRSEQSRLAPERRRELEEMVVLLRRELGMRPHETVAPLYARQHACAGRCASGDVTRCSPPVHHPEPRHEHRHAPQIAIPPGAPYYQDPYARVQPQYPPPHQGYEQPHYPPQPDVQRLQAEQRAPSRRRDRSTNALHLIAMQGGHPAGAQHRRTGINTAVQQRLQSAAEAAQGPAR